MSFSISFPRRRCCGAVVIVFHLFSFLFALLVVFVFIIFIFFETQIFFFLFFIFKFVVLLPSPAVIESASATAGHALTSPAKKQTVLKNVTRISSKGMKSVRSETGANNNENMKVVMAILDSLNDYVMSYILPAEARASSTALQNSKHFRSVHSKLRKVTDSALSIMAANPRSAISHRVARSILVTQTNEGLNKLVSSWAESAARRKMVKKQTMAANEAEVTAILLQAASSVVAPAVAAPSAPSTGILVFCFSFTIPSS